MGSPESSVKQTAAVRMALAELGIDASAHDVGNWLDARGIPRSKSFAQIVKNERRSLRHAHTAADASGQQSGSFSLPALVALKDTIGNVAEFRRCLDKVERAVAIFGSLDALRVYLDTWHPPTQNPPASSPGG